MASAFETPQRTQGRGRGFIISLTEGTRKEITDKLVFTGTKKGAYLGNNGCNG